MTSTIFSDHSVHSEVDSPAGLTDAVRRLSLVPAKDGFSGVGPRRMEDTFWHEKRRLLSGYQKFLEIDRMAARVPQNFRRSPRALVDHLVETATTDVQKYRAIFAWITTSMTVERTGKRTARSNIREAIISGVGGPGATPPNIFQHMCGLANLPCSVMTGYAKPTGHYPGTEKRYPHHWNIIQVDGLQLYCDIMWATWTKSGEDPAKSAFREEYFLAEPEQFTSEHLPTKNGKADRDHQLCATPYKSIDEWNSSPHIGPMVPCLGVGNLDLPNTLKTFDNTGKVRFRCPRGVQLWSALRRLKGEDILDDYVIHFWDEGVVTFLFRLPGTGRYKLTIGAAPEGDSPGHDPLSSAVSGVITTVLVSAEGKASFKPFPEEGAYGISFKAQEAGYTCLSHGEPIIDAPSNRLTVEVARPPDGSIVPLLFHEDCPKMKVRNSIDCETLPKKDALHLTLSKPGSYLLEVYALLHPHATENTHDLAGRFIINCRGEELNIGGFQQIIPREH